MMNRSARISVGLFFALCCVAPAEAQTFYGAAGLFVHPSAYAAPPGSRTFSVSTGVQKFGLLENRYLPASLSWGLTPRVEAGLLSVYHAGDDTHTHWHAGAFAKYQILPDTSSHPAVAITGALRQRDGLQTSVAGVLSHRFERNGYAFLTAHLGVKWARANRMLEHATDTAGFVGLELPLSPKMRLVAETSTRLDFEPSAARSIGLMWTTPSGTHVGVGYVNIGRSDHPQLFIGVGYPFGGVR
jgi:hypothetical protein